MIPRILFRHHAVEYIKVVVGTMTGLIAISLVVDFADNASWYTGPGWLRWVLELYAWRTLLVAQELAPAAFILGAGVHWALVQRRGELTALKALALSPVSLVAPLTLVAAIASGTLFLADETLLRHASRRVDEINALQFKMKGVWMRYYSGEQWFRGKRDIYRLRGATEEGFFAVTIFTLSDDFRLAKRIDAARMEPLGGTRWRLVDATSRELSGETSVSEFWDTRDVTLLDDAATFRVVKGRPEQLRMKDLFEQRALRARVGLTTERYTFAIHNKVAYPLAIVPGTLLACLLGIRRTRKGLTLAVAVAEGFALIAALWSVSVVCKAAALAGAIPPAWGAWLPFTLLAAAAGAVAVSTLRSRWRGV